MKNITIISGGQTGVDRAALDIAIQNNIKHGGYGPKGRLAEDGIIPNKYNLIETHSIDYNYRTKKNINNADATLILYFDKLNGGTLYTKNYCKKHCKQYYMLNMNKIFHADLNEIHQWIINNNFRIINIAGPRDDKNNIYIRSKEILSIIFTNLQNENL